MFLTGHHAGFVYVENLGRIYMFGYKVNGIEKIKIGDVIEFGSYGYYENGKKCRLNGLFLT